MCKRRGGVTSPNVVTLPSLSGDGSTLAYVEHSDYTDHSENKGTVIIRKTDSDEILHQFPHDHEVTSWSLSEDGNRFVISNDQYKDHQWVNNNVTVYDTNGDGVFQSFPHKGKITSISLSGDGSILAYVEDRNCVFIRNFATVEPQKIPHQAKITSMSLSRNGSKLVTVEHGNTHGPYPRSTATVTIRDVDTGTKLEL